MDNDDFILDTVKNKLLSILGNCLVSIAFHGSRARGNHRLDSDYDFFTIVENETNEEIYNKARAIICTYSKIHIQIHFAKKEELTNLVSFIQLYSIRDGRILFDKENYLKKLLRNYPTIPIKRGNL